MTDWDAANWTSEVLEQYQNMSEADVRGWTEAYFFFKAAQTQLDSGDTLTNLIYNCLPIVEEVKNLTYDDQNQWKHLAKFVSKFSAKKWNAPKLKHKVAEMAAEKTKCTSCQPGWSVSADTGACVKCPENCASCFANQTCSDCNAAYYLTD